MSTVTRKKLYTPEDLLKMPDRGKSYELVDGKLVEKKMGWDSSWIGGRLHEFLASYCHPKRMGWAAPGDASYQCFPDAPKKVRKPDGSFIRRGRLPGGKRPQGHCTIAPDVAVEVVSPKDTYSEVLEKVAEYLQAKVALVWVIDPKTRSVHVHRLDGSVTHLGEADELTGEDVIPGFRCAIRDLFKDPCEEQAVP